MNVKVYGLIEGLMVYWDEVKEAAIYNVHLFIGNWERRIDNGCEIIVKDKEPKMQEIAFISVERNMKYCSFNNLARIHSRRIYYRSGFGKAETGLEYYVVVEAEDRYGKVIEKSNAVIGRVLSIDNGTAD